MHAWQFTPYALPLFLGSLLLIAAAVLAWRRGLTAAASYMAITNLLMAIYVFAYGIELVQTTTEGILFWSKIEYIGITLAPTVLLMMVLAYSGRQQWLSPLTILLLLSVPILTILLAWSNEYHQWIWVDLQAIPVESIYIADFTPGKWYWINIGSVYLMLSTSVVILIRTYIRASRLYRRQIRLILAGAMVPIVAHLVYMATLMANLPLININWQAYAMAISALIMTWGVLNYQLFNIGPVAHHAIFESMEDSVVVLDTQDHIADLNPAAQRTLGWNPTEVVGRFVGELLSEAQRDTVWQYADQRSARAEITAESRVYDMSISPLLGRNGKIAGRLIALRDVTSRKQAEIELRLAHERSQAQFVEISSLQRKLRQQAVRDPLTGLFNRRYLGEVLEQELTKKADEETPVSIAIMDIDHFKIINDTYGHKAGDLMLQALGEMLHSHTRKSDIVCRYGGDEFVIIFFGTFLSDAQHHVEQLRSTFEKLRVPFEQVNLQATLSAGIAAYAGHDQTGQTVLQAADKALYAAKESGRNRIVTRE